MNRNKLIKSYLKYTVGIFIGIIAVYWIQYNLFPTPDIPTGLGVAEFSLIGGVAFWIERTIKFIKAILVSFKDNSYNKVNDETLIVSNKSKNKTQGLLIAIIAILLIIIFATNTDIINFSKRTMLSEVEIKYVPKESSRIQYFNGTNGILMDSILTYYSRETLGKFTGKVYSDFGLIAKVENGVVEGRHRMWDTNGQLILEEFYENGLREGVYNSWHSNGIKKTTVNYNNGEFDGIYKELQANGNIGSEIYYDNGLVNGEANIYSTDGILINKTLFINNIKNGSFYLRYSDFEDGTAQPLSRKGVYVNNYIEGDVLNFDINDDGSSTLRYIQNYSKGIMKSRTQYYNCPYDNGLDCLTYKGWMETYDDSGERISREVYKY